jgi:hypothetical protein
MEYHSSYFDGITLECYDKQLSDEFGKKIVKIVSKYRILCNQAVSHLESLGPEGGQEFTSVNIRLPHRYLNDRPMWIDIGYHDGKFACRLIELSRDCQMLIQGRFLFKDFPCWDSDSEERNFLREYNRQKRQGKLDPHTIVVMRKDNPTLEEQLPSALREKVNISNIKEIIRERFPKSSAAYKVLLSEKDEITEIEMGYKLPIWLKLAELAEESR